MSINTSPNSASRQRISADTASLSRSWRRGLTPPPNLNVVEWAERYRRLSKESSNGGRFITARVEVARGPMLAATEPGVQTITLMACTQLLKTTVSNKQKYAFTSMAYPRFGGDFYIRMVAALEAIGINRLAPIDAA
ncbi:hypothetical protein [Methylobacterium sp. ID0610]|uniref:hypothetical protein n=1 Tax=Methylobacterium carpenticola TaxID=3344827 RepID=UPI0036763289